MRIIVTGFARARELLGDRPRSLVLAEQARANDVWTALVDVIPEFGPLRASMRLARDGDIIAGDEPLRDGDEMVLLPPFGGG